MMTILERYIAKTVISATALAAVIVTGVSILMSLLRELKDIGKGDFGLGHAVFYVFLRLPEEIYQFSPMLILLGAMIGLSILSGNRELAVMRTSGFSIRKIIYSVLVAAITIIFTLSLLGEGLAPDWNRKAEVEKENARNAGQAVLTAAGVWFHVENNFIYVQHVVSQTHLENVTRYQFDNEHRLVAAYFAKSLVLENNHWQMHDVVKTNFYKERTRSEAIAQMPWELKFNANLLKLGEVEANQMSLPKLSKFINYMEKNGLQANEFKYQFWQRLFQPIASIIMIFLAIPFVLGALGSLALGWRVLIGIMTGFIFYMLNALLVEFSIVYQVPTVLAALTPLVIFAVLAYGLSRSLIRL